MKILNSVKNAFSTLIFLFLIAANTNALANSCPNLGAGIYIGSGSLTLHPNMITSSLKYCVTGRSDLIIGTGTIGHDGKLTFYTRTTFAPGSINVVTTHNSINVIGTKIEDAATPNSDFLELKPYPLGNALGTTSVNLVHVELGKNRSITWPASNAGNIQPQSLYIASSKPRVYSNVAFVNPNFVTIGGYNIKDQNFILPTDLTLKDSSITGSLVVLVGKNSKLTLDNTSIETSAFSLQGTLTGNGQISKPSAVGRFLTLSTFNNSQISPGNSIGILTVDGALSIGGATLLNSELNPSAAQNSDLLSVSGSVTGADKLTVVLQKDAGYTASGAGEIADFTGSTYVVITANSIDSNAIQLVEGGSLNAHLSASLASQPTNSGQVEIQFTDNSAKPGHLPSKLKNVLSNSSGKHVATHAPAVTLISAIAATHHGTVINGSNGGSGRGSQILKNGITLSNAFLSLTNANLIKLNNVHAEPYSSNLTIGLEHLDLVASSVMNRISGAPRILDQNQTSKTANDRRVWIDVSANRGTVKGESGLGNYGYTIGSVILGADIAHGTDGEVGVFAGFGSQAMHEHDSIDQDFSAQSGFAGLYSTFRPGSFKLAFAGAYSYSQYDTLRVNPDVGSFTGGTAEANFGAHGLFATFKLGVDQQIGERVMLTPFVTASYSKIWQESVQEKGGGDFNYYIHEADAHSTSSGVGLDGQIEFVSDPKNTMNLLGFVRYDYDWNAAEKTAHNATATSHLFGTFTQSGQNRGPNGFTAGLGMVGEYKEFASWRLGVVGSFHDHGYEMGGSAHLVIKF